MTNFKIHNSWVYYEFDTCKKTALKIEKYFYYEHL